jgi:DNA-binding MarR family transcriptional regulator
VKSQAKVRESRVQFLLSSLADGLSLEDAATAHGFLVEDARKRLVELSSMLPEHSDSFDPDMAEATAFDMPPPYPATRSSDPRHPLTLKIALLDELVARLSPDELRGLGRRLVNMAEAVEQDWRPEVVRSSYNVPSTAARIERNALELAKVALMLIQFRQQRAKFLPPDAHDGPAWDMLLELFVQFSGGTAVSTKSLIKVSRAPPTTAFRQIDRLEREGLIKRRTSDVDQRVTLIDLTRKGVVAVGRALEEFP